MMILSILSGIQGKSDSELLTEISGGSESALSILYDRHSTLIYSVLFRILQEKEEAEDMLQEVFLLVWQKAESYDPSLGNPGGWLARIARNRAVDRLRSKNYRGRSQEVDIEDHHSSVITAAGDDPEHRTVMTMQAHEIGSALAELPKEQQELIECAYYKGLTQTELAVRFNIPLGTVKTRMRTAMAFLRQRLRYE